MSIKKPLNTVADVRDIIDSIVSDRIKDFIFRGEHKPYEHISSALYREYAPNNEMFPTHYTNIIRDEINLPDKQKEIVEKAEKYFRKGTTELEIVSDLQYHGGTTNLIDFSESFLIALFFACHGQNSDDGRLILLNKRKFASYNEATDSFDLNDLNRHKNLILKSYNKNHRTAFQSTIFAYPQEGYIPQEQQHTITIPRESKKDILFELKQYHNIHEDTVYNDIQGFIENHNNFKDARAYFYMGNVELATEEFENAITHYKKAIQLGLIDRWLYRNIFNAHMKLAGHYTQTADNYAAIARKHLDTLKDALDDKHLAIAQEHIDLAKTCEEKAEYYVLEANTYHTHYVQYMTPSDYQTEHRKEKLTHVAQEIKQGLKDLEDLRQKTQAL